MSERRLTGRRASPGFAAGTVAVLAPAAAQRHGSGDPAAEAETLRAALAAALDEIRTLALKVTGDDADIIGLQIALMEDAALAEPAYAAIAAGDSADLAWAAALDAEIAGYESAADEYFRARASDLKDIRDRVLDHVAGSAAGAGPRPGAIVAARDLPPSRFLAIDWSQGGAILLTAGSASSHVAMLARSRSIPMVVGLGGDPASLAGEVLVDAAAGEVVVDPAPDTRRGFERKRAADAGVAAEAARRAGEPALTRDGTRVAVQLNISDPDELMALDPAICDGIGLVRTEFLFHAHRGLPDEETQYRIYRRIAVWAGGRPVTIRTLDAGGDKPIDGLTAAGESNPFLGLRGIRLSLARPEIFRLQLRALARAACHGSIKIMLPMITTPHEVAATRALLDAEMDALAAAGTAARRPPLGIMVEVPATAIAIDLFDAEFYSIGSNDLTQYVTAAGRDIDAVADLADPSHPAVMRLIARVARHGRDIRREVSLCGDMAGEPAFVPALLRAGLRVISVAPAALARAKAAIAAVDLADSAAAPTPALMGG